MLSKTMETGRIVVICFCYRRCRPLPHSCPSSKAWPFCLISVCCQPQNERPSRDISAIPNHLRPLLERELSLTASQAECTEEPLGWGSQTTESTFPLSGLKSLGDTITLPCCRIYLWYILFDLLSPCLFLPVQSYYHYLSSLLVSGHAIHSNCRK